jgi:hypothetical protein
MECQLFQWLIAGAGPTTVQHALAGIGCLLAYDAISRWRKTGKPDVIAMPEQRPESAEEDYRQAA